MSREVSKAEEVRDFYDRMAQSYDDLWLFDQSIYDQMHLVLLRYATNLRKGLVLDIGCGTGAQSLILAKLGFEVSGIDITSGLLKRCHKKLADSKNSSAVVQASCTNMPFRDQVFDTEVCFYNVLNHVREYEAAIKEMKRVLRKDGLMFLQVEKTSLVDIFFEVLDSILGGRLQYYETKENIVNHILHFYRNYIITWKEEELSSLKCWRFSLRELERTFGEEGFRIKRKVGIKIFQSVVPWSLETSNPQPMKPIVRFLGKLDRRVSESWPFNSMGLGTVYILQSVQRREPESPSHTRVNDDG